jgi:peptidoglycan hydrolase-like protein with peptidoglycan-binding domain
MAIQAPTLTVPRNIDQLEPNIIRWIQTQLKGGGYLDGPIDGICGPQTFAALAKFKADQNLEYPKGVGQTTLNLLAQLSPPGTVSEQPQGLNQAPMPNAGSKTGAAATLPTVGLVYANEWILPNSYLTWGEMTKNLSRRPTQASEIRNIQETARVFGRIRTKFGSSIGVTSGFRPAHLGIGVRNSQHIPGRAADIYPLNGNFATLLNVLKAEPAVKGIGLGQARGFLHMDIRPASRVIFRY